MLTAIRNNSGVLALFACITTGLIAATNYLTEDKIEVQNEVQLLSVINQVVPTSLYDNDLSHSCILIEDPDLGTAQAMPAYIARQGDKPSAIAIETIAPDGYSGDIKLIVGMKFDGTITGTRVLEHKETPGLGDKIEMRVSDWITSFNGKRVTADNDTAWHVRKDGGEFDQFTGATITPRAVVKAVKKAALYVTQHQDALVAQPLTCGGQA